MLSGPGIASSADSSAVPEARGGVTEAFDDAPGLGDR
jgi:hypothetical protein